MEMVTFAARHAVPNNEEATCARHVVNCWSEKDVPWRLQIACGGDKLQHNGDTTTHGAAMETTKHQLNDTEVSDPTARAATMDISNMHPEFDFPEAECVRLQMDSIPDVTVTACGLDDLVTKHGCVCAQVDEAGVD